MIPATNAVSERSFSASKRVKTYFRATTTDSRLNNVMVLRIHKKEIHIIDMVDAANQFIALTDNDSRPQSITEINRHSEDDRGKQNGRVNKFTYVHWSYRMKCLNAAYWSPTLSP